MSVSKIVAAAASGVGGAGLDVDEVFSTHLYDGNGSSQTITNGIDLSGEGGLVWLKSRTSSNDTGSGSPPGYGHGLFDTERGTGKVIFSHKNSAQSNYPNALTSFRTNGFSLGDVSYNYSSQDFVSWTFRKAPKFFDVVTYTGNGTNNQTFNHSLGCVPGMVIIKNTSRSGQDWWVWVNDSITANEGRLNNTGDFGYNVIGTVTGTTVQTLNQNQFATNYSGDSYVAYLFAHNNDDGGFGPDGDQDIIKCGSYTGNGTVGNAVTLGFEPQWIMIKNADRGEAWYMYDVMRGIATGGNDSIIYANASDAELDAGDSVDVTSTGFSIKRGNQFFINYTGDNYIYMAIRRGPLAVPEDATKVFAIDTQGSTGDGAEPSYRTTFPVDMVIQKSTGGGGSTLATRLTGTKKLVPESNAVEANYTTGYFDYMNGWRETTSTYAPNYGYMWKRAPGYFDVVCYTGTGSALTVTHNLGVAPEMMWVKTRETTYNWTVFHSALGNNKGAYLNSTAAAFTNTATWNNTAPTSTVFSVNNDGYTNKSGDNFIAYLFATAPGVSKVGSYTGNGSSIGDTQTIDCGFSSGARFVLIRRTSGNGEWFVFDTARGIVSGADKYLTLQSTAAEISGGDYIDPDSSGFTVVQHPATETNTNGETYIFYAIA